MARKKKEKRKLKELLKEREEVFEITPDTRLIVKIRDTATQAEVEELANNIKRLRDGEIHTLIVPYSYKFFTLSMVPQEEKTMDEIDIQQEIENRNKKKKLVAEDMKDADEQLAKVKDKIVNDS